MLDPQIHYLNHGAFGATPISVFEEYQHWQRVLETNPSDYFLRNNSNLLGHVRRTLGDFLETDSEDLTFVTNTTHAMNIIARSIRLGPGDEVLLTNHEYGSITKIWK